MPKVFNSMIQADIFIPTSNRIEPLAECLKSLNQQTNKNFHIILAGKCKDERVQSLIKKHSGLSIEYFIQTRQGLIGAANEALARAKHDIFTRLDDDVIVDKTWFAELIRTFSLDKKIGGVTGPTTMSAKGLRSRDLTHYMSNLQKGIALKGLLFKLYSSIIYENCMLDVSRFMKSGAFTLGSNYPQARTIKTLLEVDNLEACNWSARRHIPKKIGGFDELYLTGLGDYHEADAAVKIKRLGYKLVFNPKVALKHNVEMGKVEAARPAAFYRIQNFILFYFRFNRLELGDKLPRFFIYLGIQNVYFVYKFLRTGNVNQLGAIPGTIIGLLRALYIQKYYESQKNNAGAAPNYV